MQFKKSVHHQSTEKPLKVLKSTSDKGNHLEKIHSKVIHSKYHPVLVSSLFLRSYNCGQIDLAGYKDKSFIIFEVKSSFSFISKKQRQRLNQSLSILCEIFDAQGKISLLNNLPKD